MMKIKDKGMILLEIYVDPKTCDHEITETISDKTEPDFSLNICFICGHEWPEVDGMKGRGVLE